MPTEVMLVDRHVMWAPWAGPGIEYLHLKAEGGQIVADAVIIGLAEGTPFRLRYTITCDDRWRMRTADVIWLGADRPEIHLCTDGAGAWTTAAGEARPDLAGCLEVDISATPFTNTLPIRRLALQPGESRDVPAAYIDVADATVSRAPQRYTRLEAETAGDGATYRYEGLLWDFRATLPVDGDGLVTDYPGLFRRVWSG